MNPGKIAAHIPARGGSKRVPAKNLRYLAGRPMIAYAIEAALSCPTLNDVYINTDSEVLASLGERLGCKVYRRPAHLGGDDATGDDFTIDFIENIPCETLVMVSPVCPLIRTDDIAAAIDAYANSDADTLISCSRTQMQTFCDDRAINIDPKGPLAPSQANAPVSICNWAVTVWNTAKFRELYRRFNGGYCGENRLLWPLDPLRSVKVSEEKDFQLAEALLRGRKQSESVTPAHYWALGDDVDFEREDA
jgi:CMP-N,N'-diacetyllegionaminic acid synthase